MKTYKTSLLTALLLIYWPMATHSNTSLSLPLIVSSNWDSTEMIGETKFKKYGFHIYDASFWLLQKTSEEGVINSNALMIDYARNIKAEKLVSNTKKQWKKIGVAEKYPTDAWLEQLTQIWPDVSKGDLLIALVIPEGPTKFYSKDKLLGVIEDEEFGPAFLDIWLGSESRYQKNRKELLNEI